MVVHELKNDISTVRIHDECYETDANRLIGSVSRVVSAFYKRRYSAESEEPFTVAAMSERQPITTTLQA